MILSRHKPIAHHFGTKNIGLKLQKLDSEFGKILKIDIQTNKSEVVSLGHRNPQGLFYSKKYDFILSTEHGPKGGDEININHKPFSKIKNFGWPISSYGKHYKKNYSKKILSEAPLKKSHKKYGFNEPIKYLVCEFLIIYLNR